MAEQLLNGKLYNDRAVGPYNLGNGGHRENFFPLLTDLLIEISNSVTAAKNLFRATSSSTLSVSAGAKSLTVEANKGFTAGDVVALFRTSSPATFMAGTVTGYVVGTGALSISVAAGDFQGSGSASDWTVAGPVGPRGLRGLLGLSYGWDTGTAAADPGAGLVRANNASLASATAIYIDYLDSFGVNLSAQIANWAASTSTIKGTLVLRSQTDQSQEIFYDVTSVTDSTGYYTIGLAYRGGSASLAAGVAVAIEFDRTGDKGDPLFPGQLYRFDTATAAADPGSGNFRFNNGTLTAATAAYVDVLDGNAADISAWLATLATPTGSPKGVLRVQSRSNPAKTADFNLTGATNSTGYYTLALTYLSPATPPTFTASEPLAVSWTPGGNVGPTGAGSTVFAALAGVSTGTARPTMNFIVGEGVRIQVADNAGQTRTDITITAVPMTAKTLFLATVG